LQPRVNPSDSPSHQPSNSPSVNPSSNPTASPSTSPSKSPTPRPVRVASTQRPTSSSPTPPPVRVATTQSPSNSPVKNAFLEEQCCPEDTGFCKSDDSHTFGIPLLDLSTGSIDKPIIDGMIDRFGDGIGDDPLTPGWILDEYTKFLELPMFNGGKNGKQRSPLEQRERMATAYLAYDCTNNVVCVAAHLDASFMETNPTVEVDKLDHESWIRFGEDNGSAKLKESNANEFMYIGKPDDIDFIIGYEGCWLIDTIDGVENVVNNNVEVHFTNDGDTTSTGKPASNGDFVCVNPLCGPSRPSFSTTPIVMPTTNPTTTAKFPTFQPVSRPSTISTQKPTNLSTSLHPTLQPVSRPSSMTTLSPTLAPHNRVSHDQCCPADDGFCPNNDGHTFLIPLLDLSAGSAARPIIDGKIDQYGDDLGDNPVIDGWVGAEYLGFTELSCDARNGVHYSVNNAMMVCIRIVVGTKLIEVS